jgi:hypothetical protein
LLVLLLAALTTGCGASTGTVSGVVKYRGAPLPAGRVTFLCKTGKKPVFRTDIEKNGEYTVEDVPVGPVVILVESFPPAPATAPSPDVPGMNPPGGAPAPKPKPPGKYVAIPRKYNDFENPALTYTVVRGEQTHDLVLED